MTRRFTMPSRSPLNGLTKGSSPRQRRRLGRRLQDVFGRGRGLGRGGGRRGRPARRRRGLAGQAQGGERPQRGPPREGGGRPPVNAREDCVVLIRHGGDPRSHHGPISSDGSTRTRPSTGPPGAGLHAERAEADEVHGADAVVQAGARAHRRPVDPHPQDPSSGVRAARPPPVQFDEVRRVRDRRRSRRRPGCCRRAGSAASARRRRPAAEHDRGQPAGRRFLEGEEKPRPQVRLRLSGIESVGVEEEPRAVAVLVRGPVVLDEKAGRVVHDAL